MNRNRGTMLRELQELAFRMYDLRLFLDTHPCEEAAINEYNTTSNKYNTMKSHYEKLYGPLTMEDTDNMGNYWQWIDGPWPWEKLCEKEVNK